jgi:hypothetical protein
MHRPKYGYTFCGKLARFWSAQSVPRYEGWSSLRVGALLGALSVSDDFSLFGSTKQKEKQHLQRKRGQAVLQLLVERKTITFHVLFSFNGDVIHETPLLLFPLDSFLCRDR